MAGTGVGSFEGGTVIDIGGLLRKILDWEGDVIMERRIALVVFLPPPDAR
jgi:hypothetical protein